MSNEIHTQIEETTSNESEKKGLASKLVKIFVIISILIILFFISIGIVKVVPKFIASISGAAVYLSSGISGDSLTITPTEKEIPSKSYLQFKWVNTSKEQGSQYWSFKCTPGILVFYQSNDGQKPVICETLFPLPDDKEGKYSFYVESKNTSNTEVPFTISFYDQTNEKVLLSDSGSVVVTQDKNTNNTQTSTDSNQYNPNQNVTTVTTNNQFVDNTNNVNSTPINQNTYSGKPDLSIQVLETSVLGINGSKYLPINQAEYGDSVIVKFRISNIGTSPSSLWTLNASLPAESVSDRNFKSNYEPSLKPGASYDMNIVFNGFNGNVSNAITINVLSTNETTTSNNTVKIPVPSSSNDNNNTNYNSSERADLKLNILDTGIVDHNNRYRQTDSLDKSDTIGVRFEITNIGGRDSGSFEIDADLPTSNNDNYNRNIGSIRPGETKEFIIGFDNPDTGRNDINIEIDSDNDVSESNENNNDDSVRIDVDN